MAKPDRRWPRLVDEPSPETVRAAIRAYLAPWIEQHRHGQRLHAELSRAGEQELASFRNSIELLRRRAAELTDLWQRLISCGVVAGDAIAEAARAIEHEIDSINHALSRARPGKRLAIVAWFREPLDRALLHLHRRHRVTQKELAEIVEVDPKRIGEWIRAAAESPTIAITPAYNGPIRARRAGSTRTRDHQQGACRGPRLIKTPTTDDERELRELREADLRNVARQLEQDPEELIAYAYELGWTP